MTTLRPGDLEVERLGSGPPVVLVHGSVVGPERTWRAQRPLAERGWELILPCRPGFGASPPLPDGGDFEAEAPLIAALLGDGAHLVGHSYGAVIALLAAAARPEAVRSLTVSEPGALRLAAGDPAVDRTIADGETLYRHRAELEPIDFVRLFRSGVGSSHETPDALPDWLDRGAHHVMAERPPWQAEIPLAALAPARFPALVISGGHSSVFESVCDALAGAIDAQRAVIPGRGHTIPSTGEPYNAVLDAFLAAAERSSAA